MTDIEEMPLDIQYYRDEGFDDTALPDLLYVVVTECPNAGHEAWRIAQKTDALLIDQKPFWTVDEVDEHGDFEPCGYDVEVYFPTLAAAKEYARQLRANGYSYTKIDVYEIDREDYCRAYWFRSDNCIAEDRQPRKVEFV